LILSRLMPAARGENPHGKIVGHRTSPASTSSRSAPRRQDSPLHAAKVGASNIRVAIVLETATALGALTGVLRAGVLAAPGELICDPSFLG
jgi:hypothetical protein